MTSKRLEDLTAHRSKPPLRRRLKDVPVLPSMVTLANLFFGFLAIAKVADALRMTPPGASFEEILPYFETAALLVFLAMVCDALDGRVARMTGQTTNFGAQLDSLADMVTFGVVPAFIAKVLVDWHAQDDGNMLLPVGPKLFYAAAAVYVLGAAMRLARFNVETGDEEDGHREFKGMPSPAAAMVVCALVALFCTRADPSAVISRWLLSEGLYDWMVKAMPAALVLMGLLMISGVPYPHAVSVLGKGRKSLPFLFTAVLFVAAAAIEWQLALAVFAVGYVGWGLLLGAYRLVFVRRGPDDGPEDGPEDGAVTGRAVGDLVDPAARRTPSRN